MKFPHLLLALVLPASAQIISQPQLVQGTVKFANIDPLVLDLLGSPGQQGMSSLSIFASAQPPAPPLSAFATVPASGRVNSTFQITVESDPVGYPYQISIRATMGDGLAEYWFRPRTTVPVTPAGGPVSVHPLECAGIVSLRFVNALGVPVPVSGGSVRAYQPPDSSYDSPQAQRSQIPAGVTNVFLVVRGDDFVTIDTTLQTGTNTDDDRLQFRSRTNLFLRCDTVEIVNVVVPGSGALGRMIGSVDFQGEFELTVDGFDPLDYAGYTSVVADNGPFNNKRYAPVPGVNFTTPSSGPFDLQNLLPDSAEPGSDGYRVYAQAFFRTNDRFASLITPALGSGSNPPVTVTAGSTVNLSNLFVIEPGAIRGRILLKGPAESAGAPSMLRGLLRAVDGDLDDDGIPDGAGIYGVYWSHLTASGVNRRAAGARYTAWGGVAGASFAGGFNPSTAAFEGDYELVVGGLASERSLWRQETLSVTLGGGDVPGDSYYFNDFHLTDLEPAELEIAPAGSASKDLACCLGEVFIQFRSATGSFHSPQVRFSNGSFSGLDPYGRAVQYQVYLNAMFGAPFDPNAPTNSGYVRMLLPEGSYDLQAYVVPGGAPAGSLTEVERFTVQVGCGQKIRIEQCLQLSLDTPACVDTITPIVGGAVRSCTNVTRIAYRLNGAPEVDVCNACGLNPPFSFTPTLPALPCNPSTLTVTAYDAGGATSFVTTTLRYDDAPPVMQCPGDLAVDCAAGTNGAVADFDVTATDNCVGPVTVTCTPPSGSVFPIGTNAVTCVARDACGNVSRCAFQVAVRGADLSIERAFILRWTCGVLQSADQPEGPYVDVSGATSPYCAPADRPRKFYRVRP